MPKGSPFGTHSAIEVDDADSMRRSTPRVDVLHNRILVVLEPAFEVFPSDTVGRNREVHVAKEVITSLGSRHRASDLFPCDQKRLVHCGVELAERVAELESDVEKCQG